MMKTIIRFTSPIFLLFFLQCQTVLADDPIPEVTVVGYKGGGYSGSTDMGPMNAPGQGLNSQYSILSSYGKTKKCIADADEAGKKCNEAYQQLQTICGGFNATVGGLAGATSKWLFAKITGGALDATVSGLISSGSATTGYSLNDAIVPCTDLTSKAVVFCQNGVATMKKKCS